MSHEQKQPSQAPIAELMRNAAEFDESQATELARRVGSDLVTQLTDIGMDEHLLTVYKERITDPVEVQFDGIRSGERSGYGYSFPDKVDGPDEPLFIVALGRKAVQRWTGIMERAFAHHGQSFGYDGQAYDLANAWMIAHELGHGLEQAQSFINRRPSGWIEGAWTYPASSARGFLEAHPDEAHALNKDDARLIEDERRAEGIGALYTRHLLVSTGQLDEEQASKVVSTIHDIFAEEAVVAQELLPTIPPDKELRIATKDREGGLVDVLQIGYSLPLTEAELVQRFGFEAA